MAKPRVQRYYDVYYVVSDVGQQIAGPMDDLAEAEAVARHATEGDR